MIKIHAGFMIIGLLSIVTGATIAVLMREKKWWLYVHKKFVGAGFSLTLLGFIAALYMVSLSAHEHFRVFHAYLGATVVFLVSLTVIMGILQLKAKKGAIKIRQMHRRLGRITPSVMFLNLLLGLSMMRRF